MSIEALLKEIVREVFQEEIAKLNTSVDNEEILTEREARAVLRCSPDQLKKYRSEGMPYIVGAPHRYIRGQITQWIKEKYVIRRSK